ncbi:ABC transporter ATP-binding protein [Oceaniglobus roseus]|uniref:ABC transporter ATP-binding protein n=1 Tax=Oceaniglobus roseus TaxID=1737570 RepID=UPI000C7F57E2|nr:ABC transporter ATP-binding protein [Kandeliimicrobium roseum]
MTALLSMEEVSVHYPVKGGVLRRPTSWVKAVDEVTLSIAPGETLGLVGESGCGKSTLGRAVLGLRDLAKGRITFDGQELKNLSALDTRALRRDMQLIFQDPYASLDPHATIGATIRAGLDIHRIGSRAERAERVTETMRQVGLDPSLADRYPHEFSGGMRQRVVMARALVLRPRLVVCDEPTSALDVSIQSQILNLLKDLQDELGLTYLFISHNLAVVEHMADRVAVMYLGRIVEVAPRAALFAAPRHPYTQALMQAIPQPDPARRTPPPLTGDIPSPDDLPQGCRFRGRCPYAMARCAEAEPPLLGREHRAACWLVEEESTR